MKNSALFDAWSLAQSHFEMSSIRVAGILKDPHVLHKKYDLSLKNDPRTQEELLFDMKSYLEETTNTLSPFFQNQLFSGISPYALAGEWLAALTNTTMATFEVAPMATLMEKELVNHLLKKIGWKEGDGSMVTGGSNANLIGLLLARNTLYPESKESGTKHLSLVAFVSEEAHYSFDKAANVMGLGIGNVKKIRSDSQGKMSLEHLNEEILKEKLAGNVPFFVGAAAGTTVLGSYDDLPGIHKICAEHGLWFHVDGAWGGSVLLSKTHRHLMRGSELCDSMAWDTHKMLGTGLISSFFLTKKTHSLWSSHHSGGGDYIFHDNDLSAWDLGPSSLQCGKRNDAFKVWLFWRSLGDLGVEKIVDDLFLKVQMVTQEMKSHPNLELLYDPEMLNVCFRYKGKQNSNKLQKEIRQRLLKEGDFFVNVSTRKDETFFRLIVVNPELQQTHIQSLFRSIIRLGREIETHTDFPGDAREKT